MGCEFLQNLLFLAVFILLQFVSSHISFGTIFAILSTDLKFSNSRSMEAQVNTKENSDGPVVDQLTPTANTSNLMSNETPSTRSTGSRNSVVKLSELVRRDIFKEGTFSRRYDGRGYKVVVEKYNNNDYKIKRYPLPDAPAEQTSDGDSEHCEIWDDCPKQVRHFKSLLKPLIFKNFEIWHGTVLRKI